MALGGGTFQLQNKTLPGAYINFVSIGAASSNLSSRGVATVPLTLSWGPSGVIEITQSDFIKNCRSIFGYAYTADAMRPLRELFAHCRTLYAYRLNGDTGTAATGALCNAKYKGAHGNDISYNVVADVDNVGKYIVSIFMDGVEVDTQTVSAVSELKDNDYVKFNSDATLEAVVGAKLSEGTDGAVTGDNYSAYFNAIEGYSFNVMGIPTDDVTVKRLAVANCKRMREEVGKHFQVVVYNYPADYEGVINVVNAVRDETAAAYALVYWVTGASAGCGVNESLMNTVYDGEYFVNVDYSQTQLEAVEGAGQFIMHSVNGKTRVLYDENSLVTLTEEKNYLFQDNKVIRICDQIANDVATIFVEKYLGKIPNDTSGRVSLWNDVVDLHNKLQTLRAIQDFSSEDITVEQGEQKNAVLITDRISVTGTMAKLYMIVQVA